MAKIDTVRSIATKPQIVLGYIYSSLRDFLEERRTMSERAAAVVIGDTHIHNFKLGGPLDEQEVSLRANQVLHGMLEVAERHDPEWFIQLGDLHHVSNPPPAIIGSTRRVLERIAQRSKIVILAGNHDQASDRAHTLLAYQGMHNVFVVAPSSTFVGCPYVVAVAWATKSDPFIRALSECNVRDIANRVLVAHSALVAPGIMADASTEAAAVVLECPREHRPITISGHLHNFKKYNAQKVIQLGAFHGTAHGEFDVGHYMVRDQSGRWDVRRQRVPIVLNTTENTYVSDIRDASARNPQAHIFAKIQSTNPRHLGTLDALEGLEQARGLVAAYAVTAHTTDWGSASEDLIDATQLDKTDALDFSSAVASLISPTCKHREEVMNLAQEIAISAKAQES